MMIPGSLEWKTLIQQGWYPNTKIVWVIDTPKLEADKFASLKNILSTLNIAFIDVTDKDPIDIQPNAEYVYFPIGTKRLTRYMREHHPFFIDDRTAWGTPSLVSTFKVTHILNHDTQFARHQHINWTNTEKLFIKPAKSYDEVQPTFKGRCFTEFQFSECIQRLSKRGISVDTIPLEVAAPKHINGEYRFFIAGGEIIGQSRYALNGEMSISSDVPAHVSAMPNYFSAIKDTFKIFAEGHYVLDIADTPDGPKIIEMNTLHSSGLYDIDLYQFVVKTQKYLEKTHGIESNT